MTPQMRANLELARWQAMRELPPEERIDRLMSDFFKAPVDLDVRYSDVLAAVRAEMAE